MVEIKGAAVTDTIKTIKTRYGEEVYQNIINLLDAPTKNFFTKPIILPSEWFPLSSYLRFLECNIRLTANGNENELIARSNAIVEEQLKGIFKVFVKLGSPEFIINRISVVHKTYFQGVSIDVTMENPNKAVIRYSGFEKEHRLIEFIIIGFYTKALEISGAKNVIAKYITSIEDDKGYCELMITWTGK